MPSPKRGKLTIYLGMAAGVGKTYRMLADAQGDVLRGADLVLGYLEPHGRAETEDQAQGLPAIPVREIDHKGLTLREPDVDTILARHPAIVLIDELAHSNAVGSRHTKRWQDVEEIRDAGIDVRTTMNVQHVESLRDDVARITGVFVAETVPDEVVEGADEIEIVDLPPEELRRRLEEGKVYRPEKVDAALAGFFQKGNLLALRELALRRTAERVDDEMRRSRSLSGGERPWHAGERILVCVAPNPMASRVVRAARRLAGSLHGELIAVSVDSPRQSRVSGGNDAVEEALRLAESLGAETAMLAGEDIVTEILRYARGANVTTIVMGKPVRPRWKEILFGSVADTMIRSSGEIDVLVITDKEKAGSRRAKTRDLLQRTSFRPQDVALALVAVAVATAIGKIAEPVLGQVNLGMLYVLATAAVAVRTGFREAVLSAFVGAVAFNFFFIPPLYTFAISDAAYLVTLLTMLVVSVLISGLAARQREATAAIAERQRATAALYDLTRSLNRSADPIEMARAAVAKAESLLGVPAAVAVPAVHERDVPEILAGSSDAFEAGVQEIAVMGWAIGHGQPAGRHTDTLAGARGGYLPLLGEAGTLGALGVEWDAETPPATSARHLAEAIAAALAGALERLRLASVAREFDRSAGEERLRGDLLSSVSHDLRTPLAAIEGTASVLQQRPGLDEEGRELAATIREESARLSRLVRNLLDMTRIQSGARLELDWQDLGEIAATAVRRVESGFTTPIEILASSESVLLRADGVLIEQTLINLLENAERHAGREARVRVTIATTPGSAVVSVEDDGPGIPSGEEERIFERFHRHGTQGFGLGLAIARAVAEAHGGTLAAGRSEGGRGARFTLTLPCQAPPETDHA